MYIFSIMISTYSVIKAAFDIKFCWQKSEENSGKSFYNILGKINPATDFGKGERKQICTYITILFIHKIEEILAWYILYSYSLQKNRYIHYTIKVVI